MRNNPKHQVHTTALVDYKNEFASVTSSIVETISWQATQQHGTFIADTMGEATHIASGAQRVLNTDPDDAAHGSSAAGSNDATKMVQLLQSLKHGAGSSNTLKVSEKAHDSYVGHLISVAHTYQVTGTIGSTTIQSNPVGIVLQPAAAATNEDGTFELVHDAAIRRSTARVVATKERDPAAWEGTLEMKAARLLTKKLGRN